MTRTPSTHAQQAYGMGYRDGYQGRNKFTSPRARAITDRGNAPDATTADVDARDQYLDGYEAGSKAFDAEVRFDRS